MRNIVIIGASGFGREVADTIRRINERNLTFNILGFIDDDSLKWGKVINGIKVLGGIDYVKKNLSGETSAVIAIASAKVKSLIVNKLDDYVKWETIIDPSVIISPYSKIGEGTIIQPFSILCPNTYVGNHCTINLRCSIGHDAIVEDFVSMMSYCDITGHVHLKQNVYLGSSVCIIPNVKVQENSVIGAGSVVVRDIIEQGTYAGVPAKLLK